MTDQAAGGGERRHELAEFLRARREELQPEDVGIARGRRRRVPGLRRHEVADLAFVSDTWYTWLEQGRDIRVSADAIDSVSRAMRLDDAAWRYIRRLAGVPVIEPPEMRADVDPNLVGVLDDLLPNPGFLTNASTDLLAWNRAYAALYGDPANLPTHRRNALWQVFMSSEVRDRVQDWELIASESVARFRTAFGADPTNHRSREVVADLSEASEVFRKMWQLRQVRRFVGHVQTCVHPEVGPVRSHQLKLVPADRPDLVLSMHRLLDDDSRKRVERLLSRSLAA